MLSPKVSVCDAAPRLNIRGRGEAENFADAEANPFDIAVKVPDVSLETGTLAYTRSEPLGIVRLIGALMRELFENESITLAGVLASAGAPEESCSWMTISSEFAESETRACVSAR